MNDEKVRLLIGQPEGQNLEYKLAVPPSTVIAKTIAAFANAEGGVLILGVDDNTSIIGLADNVPSAAMVEASIARLHPRPEVKHYPLEVELDFNIKKLYVVEIAKSSNKIFTENKLFIRNKNIIFLEKPSAPNLDLGEYQQPDCVLKVFERLLKVSKNATASKIKLLSHYRNLLTIVKQTSSLSINILFSTQTEVPSDFEHGRMLIRLFFSSLIDTFETYLVNLLIEIHLAKPETLRSSYKVSVEDVLNCQNMEEFINFAANEQVKNLTRGNEKSFMEALKFTNLDLFIESEIEQAKNYFQIRHLYTHKNGIIDTQFLSKIKLSSVNLGDEHKISLNDFCEATKFFIDIIDRLDSSVVAKYSLETYNLED
ncbi:AlbA family DNA-binding domain-containing protein [Nostoc sp. CALU 1950]|uniref:AlbA family DNA-binding domain-containing protein n=1 Tax=Nostoc sp. CALU 1950 TaxID=3104321 RepID=UPI003EC01144